MYPIQIYTLGNTLKLNLFIVIGYVLPTIGEYMLVEYIYISIGYILPTIEEYMLVEFIYWYWTPHN